MFTEEQYQAAVALAEARDTGLGPCPWPQAFEEILGRPMDGRDWSILEQRGECPVCKARAAGLGHVIAQSIYRNFIK